MRDLNLEVIKHESSLIYGKVKLSEGVSTWPYSVIRSEFNCVEVGRFSNIQDFVMLHVGDRTDTLIGDYCTIAHRAVIHGAKIGNNCLIGVGAIIMDGCDIGDNSIVDSGVYLPPNTCVPPCSIVKGNPGSVVKERNNFIMNRMSAVFYNVNAQSYQKGKFRAWSEPEIKKKLKAFYWQVCRDYKKEINKKRDCVLAP